jgi:hypothetical protein
MAAFLDKAVLSILCISILLHLVVAPFTNDFSNYPEASISCLTIEAEESGCDAYTTTTEANNACLCSNVGNWITNSARCIAASNPNDPSNILLTNVWNVMVSNCGSTNTPVTLTWEQFLAAAQSGTSLSVISASSTGFLTSYTSPSTTQSSSTPTESTSAPSQMNTGGGDSSGGKLNKSDIIAIAVGVPGTIFTIIGVIIGWRMCCGRR